MRNQPVVERLCAVVPHPPECLHHRGNFDQSCHIAPGSYGYHKMGYSNTKYVEIIYLKPSSVFDYVGLPFHESHHNVD